MKRIILGLVLALTILLVTVLPAFAAPPNLEEWDLYAFSGMRMTMTINTVNLKTDHFTVYNNNQVEYCYLYVKYNDVIVWEVYVPPMTTQNFNYSVNFQRLPHTDPDNPDSIRYPEGYSFGASTRTNPP